MRNDCECPDGSSSYLIALLLIRSQSLPSSANATRLWRYTMQLRDHTSTKGKAVSTFATPVPIYQPLARPHQTQRCVTHKSRTVSVTAWPPSMSAPKPPCKPQQSPGTHDVGEKRKLGALTTGALIDFGTAGRAVLARDDPDGLPS